MTAKPFTSGLVSVNDLNGAAYVLDRSAVAVAVANTTETTVYSYAIPANALGSDWALEMVVRGELRDDSAQTMTLRVKLAATTMFAGATSFGVAATQDFLVWLELSNQGATNSQKLTGRFEVAAGATAATTTGTGNINVDSQHNGVFGGTAAVDTTSSATLTVTVQWDGTPSVGLTKKYGRAVLL